MFDFGLTIVTFTLVQFWLEPLALHCVDLEFTHWVGLELQCVDLELIFKG